jgi:GTPase SAR1 family protein
MFLDGCPSSVKGDIPFVLIGNKEDLTDSQEVTSNEATNFAFSVESEAIDLYKRSAPAEQQAMVEFDPAPVESESSCC